MQIQKNIFKEVNLESTSRKVRVVAVKLILNGIFAIVCINTIDQLFCIISTSSSIFLNQMSHFLNRRVRHSIGNLNGANRIRISYCDSYKY